MIISTKAKSIHEVYENPIIVDGKTFSFRQLQDSKYRRYALTIAGHQYEASNTRYDELKYGLEDLVSLLPNDRPMKLLEIGVLVGQGTDIFLQSGKFQKIYSIDPWKNMELQESIFDCFFGGYFGKTIEKIKGTIDDFISKYSDEIDIVYIDGGHTFEMTSYIIQKCIDVIKPKIAIAGHDYCNSWKGVVESVDKFFKYPDVVFSDSSWIKFI